MKAADLEIERFPDGNGDDTLGWLVRYADGRAIWCGELTRAEFLLQPADIRTALRNDLVWFLVECETREGLRTQLTVLGGSLTKRRAWNWPKPSRSAVARSRP